MTTPRPSQALYPITLFIDSAEREKVEPWLQTGIFAGVTTNPTLLRAAGLGLEDAAEVYRWATCGGKRQVCFQVWGDSAADMYRNAMCLRDKAPAAIVKVPCTTAGAQVVARLSSDGIPTLMTGVYAAKQALIAAGAGATYLAPYDNRMTDSGRDALGEISRMCQIIPQTGQGPLVLAASIKSSDQIVELAAAGVRTFTLSPEVVEDLFTDALTESAVDVFESDMAAVLGRHG